MVSGFGVDLFGQFQFGHADVGYDLLYNKIPDIYKELDAENDEVLKKFILALRDELNVNIVPLIDQFPLLRDARFVRLEFLDFLAGDYGIKTDEEETEQFRRSEVLHLYQWLIRKGEDKGYRIRAGVRGYTIEVVRLDRKRCGVGVADLIEEDKERFIRLYDDTPADVIKTDDIFADELDAWPHQTLMISLNGSIDVLCRSNILLINILYSLTPNPNPKSLLKFITSAVNDVKPIHVRLIFNVIIPMTVVWDIVAELFEIEVLSAFGAADWSYYYDSHDQSERVDFAIKPSLEVVTSP